MQRLVAFVVLGLQGWQDATATDPVGAGVTLRGLPCGSTNPIADKPKTAQRDRRVGMTWKYAVESVSIAAR